MTWFQALILGVIQGLTEFLPISSSGHLVVLPLLLNWESRGLFFDVILHLGTSCALIIYFKKDIFAIIKGILINRKSKEAKLGVSVLLGTIPAVVLGFLFESSIEEQFRSGVSVASFLILGTLIMIAAEYIGAHKEKSGINGLKALIIGFFQALALFPGVSRSGATISGGMFTKLSREDAARFSFLLSIPVILGAAAFKIIEMIRMPIITLDYLNLAVGFGASLLMGYIAIDFLLKFLKSRSLWVFIIYRLLLAIFLFVTFM